MEARQEYAVPTVSRWLIEAAAALAPRPLRKAWKREWLWETWHGYYGLVRDGSSSSRASRRAALFAFGALIDAADLRLEHLRLVLDGRTLARDPRVSIAGLLLAFLALAGWTHGFRHARTAASSEYPQSDQLVLLSRPAGVLGLEGLTSMEQVWSWVEYSRWFGSVAGFVVHDGVLEVSPNFFSVLHTDPSPAGSEHWRFLGRPVRTVKVLAPGYSSIRFGGAIARLKHPANRGQLESQLAKIGGDGGVRVTATFLDERSRWPLYFAGVVSLVFLGAGAIRVRRTLPYLAFFITKSALVVGIVGAAWTEVATAIPIPVTGGVDLSIAIPLVGLLLLSQVFVMRWSLQDQAGRCPVCCRIVAMPVSFGSRASVILDRPGVDFLCTRGHGTLRVSDLTMCTAEPYRWTPLDSSWRDIFADETTV